MAEVAVRVENLSKRFRIYHQRNVTLKQALLQRRRGRYEEFWALQDVGFTVNTGSTLGIIGENGSGKSTLLKCIARILIPDQGSVAVEGRLAALLELGAGFHPEYSGRENIYLNGALLGIPRRYIDRIIDDIIDFSELARFIDNPVKTYSSGMYARLGFAIAVNVDPDVLAVDEVLAVGDESFQRRCYDRIAQLKAEGRTMVVVSHDLEAVRELCTDCLWMEHGRLRAAGTTGSVIGKYMAEVNRREAEVLDQRAQEKQRSAPTREGVGVRHLALLSRGREGHHFESGAPIEVRIEYFSPRPLRGTRFTVNLVREDGVLLASLATSDREMASATLPPTGVVRLQIPRLPLLEGSYHASLGLTDIASETAYTEVENAWPFRVSADPVGNRAAVSLEHRWELPLESDRSVSA